MRDMFSEQLVQSIQENPNIYLLSGDHGYALFDLLRSERPDHFINAGIAEQNMIGVGAGLSKVGLYPIMYGLAAFVPIRVLEQIKIDFCYENLPGLFIGDGAGVVYSYLGTSHQSTEDISALRAIPKISILSPCDKIEFNACFRWAIQQKSPVYLRIGKSDLSNVHESEISDLSLEPIPIITNGHFHAVYATGSMVSVCKNLIVSKKLKTDLYSVPVLKAPEKIIFEKNIKKYNKISTIEEHSVYGGLGDIIAAETSRIGSICLQKIGIEDKFSEKCGSYKFLMKEHGLDEESILKKIASFL